MPAAQLSSKRLEVVRQQGLQRLVLRAILFATFLARVFVRLSFKRASRDYETRIAAVAAAEQDVMAAETHRALAAKTLAGHLDHQWNINRSFGP